MSYKKDQLKVLMIISLLYLVMVVIGKSDLWSFLLQHKNNEVNILKVVNMVKVVNS